MILSGQYILPKIVDLRSDSLNLHKKPATIAQGIWNPSYLTKRWKSRLEETLKVEGQLAWHIWE